MANPPVTETSLVGRIEDLKVKRAKALALSATLHKEQLKAEQKLVEFRQAQEKKKWSV